VRVLGVDPGLRITGYGVVEGDGVRFRLIEGGVLRPHASHSLERRLTELHDAMLEIVQNTRPNCMVVEELWSAPKHPPTAVLMGHARGVIALAAGRCDVAFEQLSHVTVKRALTGNGAASKAQVKAMVCTRLGLRTPPEPDDVSDALALALVFALRANGGEAMVMERAQIDRSATGRLLRARTGGAEPGAERR
jgi:crossover junction endodeoxyribonuclease RuvC